MYRDNPILHTIPVALSILILLCCTGCTGDNVLSARGLVLNPAGEPVPGAEVVLLNGGDSDQEQTDLSGRFSVHLVAAPWSGRFRLSVTRDGHKEAATRLPSTDDHRLIVVLAPSGSAEDSAFESWPAPCSDPWIELVEAVLSSGDGMGHGPDLGSDEWKSVMEFKLGVRGNADVPDRSTRGWCDYIDALLDSRSE